MSKKQKSIKRERWLVKTALKSLLAIEKYGRNVLRECYKQDPLKNNLRILTPVRFL